MNSKGRPRPTFARVSQNMAVAAALLDTLPTPSAEGVDRVYRTLKDILGITTAKQAESSLWHWAGVSVLIPSRSKADQQKTATKPSVAKATSSLAQILAHVRPGPMDHHTKP
jgi:hypothetical protein